MYQFLYLSIAVLVHYGSIANPLKIINNWVWQPSVFRPFEIPGSEAFFHYKSAFDGFGSTAIFDKWSQIVFLGRILSDFRGNQQMKNEAEAKAKEKSEISDIQQV